MIGRRRMLLLACLAQPALVAAAAAPVVVSQVRRTFSIRELHIKRGDLIRFSNADEFLHQIFVRSPNFNFNSGVQDPGHDVDVAFPVAGTFDVRCEIHPRMVLTVTVE